MQALDHQEVQWMRAQMHLRYLHTCMHIQLLCAGLALCTADIQRALTSGKGGELLANAF